MIDDNSIACMDYENLDREIKRTMRRSASDAVRLGYLLRKMYDGQLWMERYDCLDEYLQRELHMDYSMATRFMNINKKYSVGGSSEEIADDWTGFSQSVLIEMLNMPPELAVMVTPDMSVRQVQEVKRQARREKQEKRAEGAAAAEGTAPAACSIPAEALVQEADPLPESGADGSGAEAFPAKDGIPDAEYRELEPAEEVATSQLPELVKPDKRQSLYLDDFAKGFIRSRREWMLADFTNRVSDVTKSPEEIKGSLSEHERTWYFASGEDKMDAAHIKLLDGHVSLWDGGGGHMGDFDWFYVAAAIQSMWNVVALELVAAQHMDTAQAADVSGGDTVLQEDAAEDESGAEPEANPESGTASQTAPDSAYEAEPECGATDELAAVRMVLKEEQNTLDECLKAAVEDKRILECRLFKRQSTIVAALKEMVCRMEEPEAEPDPEQREQPPLPLLKNNDQRREWLKSYKDWGLWYRDDNIGADYYKYDFDNGARLVVEVYQEEATRYYEAHESSFLHLIGGPDPMKGQHGIGKWQRHEKYTRYPNSETELIEFLKELQKKGGHGE